MATKRKNTSVTRVRCKRKAAKRKAVKRVVKRKTTTKAKKQAPLRRIKVPANTTVVIAL